MKPSLRPLLAACAAAAVAAAVLLVLGGAEFTRTPPSGDPPVGAALSAEDRGALGAVPLERGAEPVAADPAVDMAYPEAVARAYLAAAHSVVPGDTGHSHLRASAYALPGSAAASVGVVVLDPPPAGAVRTATVTALGLVAVDRAGERRGYRAEIGTATGAPGGPLDIASTGRHVVLVRTADMRWLVTAESVETPDLPSGED